MQIIILATGRCRDRHIRAIESEYLNRLPDSMWRVNIRELADAATPDEEAGGQLVALAAVPSPSVKILLDESGDSVTSRSFAGRFGDWQQDGIKAVCFLIGGANGVSERVMTRIDWVLSLGRLTLPHQMVRMVLAEQLYRMHTLLVGHPYHRD